jgi:hypothetical protein
MFSPIFSKAAKKMKNFKKSLDQSSGMGLPSPLKHLRAFAKSRQVIIAESSRKGGVIFAAP